MLTDSYRIWERKFTDFLPFFLRGEREQAYGLLTDSYRIWERKFTDLLPEIAEKFPVFFFQVFYGGLRIPYGFLPDSGKKAYEFFTGFFGSQGFHFFLVAFLRLCDEAHDPAGSVGPAIQLLDA